MGSCVSHASVSPSGGSKNDRDLPRKASLPPQRSPVLRPSGAPTGAGNERGDAKSSSFLTAELSAGRVRQYSASSGIVFKPVFPHRSEFPFGVRVTELARVRKLLVHLVRDPVAATQQQRAWNSNHTHISLAEADRGSREEPFHLERVSRNVSSIWIRAYNAVKLLYGFSENDAQNELLDEHEFRSALRFVYCFLEFQNVLDASGVASGAASTTSPAATLSPVVSAREEATSKRGGGAADDDSGGDAAAAVSRSFENFSADVSQTTRDGQHHVSFALSVSPATPPLLLSPSHASLSNLPPPNVFRVSLSYYRTHVIPALGIAGRRLSLAADARQSPITEFTDAAPLTQTYEILREPDALFERVLQLEGSSAVTGPRSPAGGSANTGSAAAATGSATVECGQHLSLLGNSEPSCRHDELCDVICRALLEAHVFRQRD